jgi:hypothetical protein
MLTNAQLILLRDAILADPALAAFPNTQDGAFDLATALDALVSPAFIVWRTSVSRGEILQNGFDWTRLDNLSVGKARVWSDIFVDGAINPSKLNVRIGIESVWVGTAADLAVRAAVYVPCKRSATKAEKILATGTGSDATPATMTHEGRLSYDDVLAARNLA